MVHLPIFPTTRLVSLWESPGGEKLNNGLVRLTAAIGRSYFLPASQSRVPANRIGKLQLVKIFSHASAIAETLQELRQSNVRMVAATANEGVQYRLIPRVAIWTQFENYPNAELVRGSAPRGLEDLPRSLATQLSPRLCASSLEAQDRVPGRRPDTQSMSNGSQTVTT
jgi:hypothetical protein